jgi:hypothetical protein
LSKEDFIFEYLHSTKLTYTPCNTGALYLIYTGYAIFYHILFTIRLVGTSAFNDSIKDANNTINNKKTSIKQHSGVINMKKATI